MRGQGSGPTWSAADDAVVTDGPFLETKEALGGYYLIDAPDLDAALAVARDVPAPFGGVEVRPGHLPLRWDRPTRLVADAHRHEWGPVLAATVRVTRDLDLAEECVQDAYAQALTTWRDEGVPPRPGAWLTTAARRRALDRLRRAEVAARALPLLVTDEVAARRRGLPGRPTCSRWSSPAATPRSPSPRGSP